MSVVPRETWLRIAEAKAIILAEANRQNLIARSTIPKFNDRHINDSLQLLNHIGDGSILDIGSGGGFPGLILACAVRSETHLVEPRARRAAFLQSAAEQLGLDNVAVHPCRVERVIVSGVRTITARAVAPLARLFAMALHLADDRTRWVLHKGRTAASELEEAKQMWQGAFSLIPSVTDADASIIVAEGVRRRQPS